MSCLILLAVGCADESAGGGGALDPEDVSVASPDSADAAADTAESDSTDTDGIEPAEDVPTGKDAADVAPDAATEPDADTHVEPEPDVGPEDVVDPDTAFDVQPRDTVDASPDGDVERDVDPTTLPCNPPLAVSPEAAWASPLDLLVFAGSGGTGEYQFEFESNNSGALLSELLGTYLAGSVTGVEDTVVLTDLGCAGEATATVVVVPPLAVMPPFVEVVPGASLDFDALGGSGLYTWEISVNESGATVDVGGVYTAGSAGEDPDVGAAVLTDTVVLTDASNGSTVVAIVTVDATASLVAAPTRLLLADGSAFPPTVQGGSGTYAYTSTDSDVVEVEAGVVQAVSPGKTMVEIADSYTGMTLSLPVEVAASVGAPTLLAGDRSQWTETLNLGDVDGNGYDDVAVGSLEADLSGFNSGAVHIYRGTENGIDPEPVLVLSGEARRDGFGRALATGDFLGPDPTQTTPDGHIDLIVGAAGADPGAANVGAVYIYAGLEDGFFSETPSRVIAGEFGGDQVGHSVGACDFNADGRLDLAIGAITAEDRELAPLLSSQGGVLIYLGFDDGLLDEWQDAVWGKTPDSGMWVDTAGVQLGRRLAVGDVDGDGACDLITGGTYFNDGGVFVYRGIKAVEGDVGGVETNPWVAWNGGLPETETASQLGRWLVAGDVSGDGLTDILMAQHAHDEPGLSNNGAARLVLGRADLGDGAAAYLSSDDVDWSVTGDAANDIRGLYVAIGEADGEPPLDVIVGDVNDVVAGYSGRPGALRAYRGSAEGAAPESEPFWELTAGVTASRFGLAGIPVSDSTGDGVPEVVVLDGWDDVVGPDFGRLWALDPTTPPESWTALDWSWTASGSQVGWRTSVPGDWTGDGLDDLFALAPLEDFGDLGVNVGTAYVYPQLPEGGFAVEPAAALRGFERHSIDDRFGWDVSRAGDFDGDGTPDIAILARNEDKPGTLPTDAFSLDASCQGAVANSGAIYVHRGAGGPMAEDKDPDWMYFGPQSSQVLTGLVGDLDINGDGLSDLVFTSNFFDAPGNNNAGGVGVIFGRNDQVEGMVRLICEADALWFGVTTNDSVGRNSPAALGDIDGDGCAEFAVGADGEDLGLNNQGGVWVIFGWGGPTCPAEPRVLHLVSGSANAQAGFSVVGGGNLDGDAIPDLLVGGIGYRVDNIGMGGTWAVLGSWLAALEPTPLIGDTLDGTVPTHPFVPAGTEGLYLVHGSSAGERFGSAVAFVEGWSGGGRDAVAVGASLMALEDGTQSGGAHIYTFQPPPIGFTPEPLATFPGETTRGGGRIGEWVSTHTTADHRYLTVGGFDGSGFGLDDGSAYVFDLGAPPE